MVYIFYYSFLDFPTHFLCKVYSGSSVILLCKVAYTWVGEYISGYMNDPVNI